jgi:16S rRNA (adenine1518-N6/adenine1519-N6)-dimethyltransferase
MSLSVVPKKSLGQNFLVSERAIRRIVEATAVKTGQWILEIGPGMGALTGQLIERYDHVVAIEKDDVLYSSLLEQFATPINSGKFHLIHTDILDFNQEKFFAERKAQGFIPYYAIVANIPYNITGLIFRKFLTTAHQPESMVVLIQKEVATRILAKESKESLLSLSIKAYGTTSLVTHVSRGSFNPSPNVDSSVIHIKEISKQRFISPAHEDLFFILIHAGFGHKRKMFIKNMLDNNLGTREFWEKVLIEKNMPTTIRAEDLSIDDWIFITNIVYTTYYGN